MLQHNLSIVLSEVHLEVFQFDDVAYWSSRSFLYLACISQTVADVGPNVPSSTDEY